MFVTDEYRYLGAVGNAVVHRNIVELRVTFRVTYGIDIDAEFVPLGGNGRFKRNIIFYSFRSLYSKDILNGRKGTGLKYYGFAGGDTF